MELDSTEINKIQYALVHYIAKLEEDKTVSKELINSYIELLERIELN
jgi:hypothetical protein